MSIVRLLQIHCFYERYLNQFYAAQPALIRATFKEQSQALLRDFFSGSHMFAPYLAEHGFQTELVIANCIPSQLQWLREHAQESYPEQGWVQHIARIQIESFRPEVLYLSHPIDFGSDFIRSLSYRPKLVMGWRAARIDAGTDWSAFDLILSHLAASREQALAVGARRVEHFFPGFPEDLVDILAHEKKQYDVTFSGQWSNEHLARNQFLSILANAASCGDLPCQVRYFIAKPEHQVLPDSVAQFDKGPRWGLEMHRALRRAKVVINAEIDLARGEAGNMRLFEVTGTGSFLLTQYHDNISQYFKPGVEIETFKDGLELLDKVAYYLKNEEKREQIALAGQRRCIEQYGMKKRSIELAKIIKQAL